MSKVALFACRVDAFCGRLNAGLAAVAIVLAILIAVTLLPRLPLLPAIDCETGISVDDP